MPTTIRAGLAGLISILLALALLGGTPRAEASPRMSPPPDGAGSQRGVTLSATQWKAAKLVTSTRNSAVSKGGGTMDYRKAKKIFATNKIYGTDWRRQMAAGYRQTGGKILHISKAENKKVEAVRKKLYGKKKARLLSDTPVRAFGPHCTGKSGKVVINKHESHTYFNSCQTNDIAYAWAGCVATMGAVIKWLAKKVPQAEIPAYLVGGFCTLELGTVKRAQENSGVKAIFVRMYQQQTYIPYPGGVRYFIHYTVESQ